MSAAESHDSSSSPPSKRARHNTNGTTNGTHTNGSTHSTPMDTNGGKEKGFYNFLWLPIVNSKFVS